MCCVGLGYFQHHMQSSKAAGSGSYYSSYLGYWHSTLVFFCASALTVRKASKPTLTLVRQLLVPMAVSLFQLGTFLQLYFSLHPNYENNYGRITGFSFCKFQKLNSNGFMQNFVIFSLLQNACLSVWYEQNSNHLINYFLQLFQQ